MSQINEDSITLSWAEYYKLTIVTSLVMEVQLRTRYELGHTLAPEEVLANVDTILNIINREVGLTTPNQDGLRLMSGVLQRVNEADPTKFHFEAAMLDDFQTNRPTVITHFPDVEINA